MPVIKPISDLRNHADQISHICHRQAEPVFITKNGKEDIVVMSQALYDQQRALLELYQKIEAADREAAKSIKGLTHREMMDSLRRRIF